MINFDLNTLCKIDYTSDFKKQLKKIIKQDKDIKLLLKVITILLTQIIILLAFPL